MLLVPLLIALPLLTGPEFEGARRWLPIGPVRLQPALILLPLVLAAPRSLWRATANLLSLLALAVQPDWGTLFALTGALIAIARGPLRRIGQVSFAIALIFLALHLSTETATTVRFVEEVFVDLPQFPPGAILAYVAALLLGAWAIADDHATPPAVQLFWGAALVAALLGPYPTPLLGLSASVLLGLFLSLPSHASLRKERRR